MNEEVTAIRVTLQGLIVKAENEYGSDHDFVSALRSADDNLAEAEEYDFEADEEGEGDDEDNS